MWLSTLSITCATNVSIFSPVNRVFLHCSNELMFRMVLWPWLGPWESYHWICTSSFSWKGVKILHAIANPFPVTWHTDFDNAQSLHWPTIQNLNTIFRLAAVEFLGLASAVATWRTARWTTIWRYQRHAATTKFCCCHLVRLLLRSTEKHYPDSLKHTFKNGQPKNDFFSLGTYSICC